MIDPTTEDQAVADAPPSMSDAIAETAMQVGNYAAPMVHALSAVPPSIQPVAIDYKLDASAKSMALQEPAPTPEPFEAPSQMADALRKSAEGMFNQSRQDLNSSIFQATSKNPDEEAAAQKLGAATGVGSGIALRNKDELARRKAMDDARNLDLIKNNPLLADKLISDPQFAAVAHDDLSWWDKYGKLAHSVMFPAANPAWFAESVMQTSMGKAFAGGTQVPVITELQREQALSPNGELTPEREQELQALEAQQAQTQQETGGMLNTPASMAGNIVGMLESLAEYTTAGATIGGTAGLLGGPFAEVTVPGGMIFGATSGFSTGMAAEFSKQAMYANYRQSRLQGISHEQALSNAHIVGVANAVFNAGALKLVGAPIGAAISSLAEPIAKSVVVPTAKAILIDYLKAYGLHEIGAFGLGAGLKASEIGAAKISGIKTTEGAMNIAEEILTSGAHTAYDFALLNALFPLLPTAAQYRVLKDSEMRQSKFKAKIKSVAENNKTKNRSTEQMQNGIESVTPESEQFIYVDQGSINRVLMQSGASAKEIEQILPGVLAQINANEPDIKINSAHYLANEVASTNIGKALEPNLRMEKGGLSPNEILQQNIDDSRVRAESKAAVEQYAKMNAGFVESAQKVEDLYFKQLVAAGYKEQEARFHASMIRDYYAVIAAREKKTPEQVQAERPYTIVSEQQARERQAAQAAQQAPAQVGQQDPNILRQEAVPATFYSALGVEVGKSTTKSASADSWKQQIKGLIAKGVVKEKEVYWSGLDNWLALQEGKITKEQVQAFLDAGGVKVEFETKGNKLTLSLVAANIQETLEAGQVFDIDAQDALEQWQKPEVSEKLKSQYEALLNEKLNDAGETRIVSDYVSDVSETKYEAYQLPGGTNYREVLVTLPSDALGTRKIMEGDKVVAIAKNDPYRSAHWNQENVLVHLRMNDRVDADGKKVLFVEEVQSDWGQAGREKGFVNETQIEIEKLEKQKSQAESDAEPYTSQGKDAPTEIADRWNFAANRLQALRSQEVSAVPTAPFIESTSGWLELGLKQILLEAVNGGYDRVAFVDGDQSVQRYRKALTEAVDAVEITRNDDGTYTYSAIKGEPVQGEQSVSANRINEVFGKAGSKQLLEEADAKPDEIHTIASGDIEIGGEGMRKFYDTIVPQALSKMLKKLGGDKIENVNMITEKPVTQEQINAAEKRKDFTEAERLTAIYERQQLGRGISEKGDQQVGEQQGFAVTPALAEQVSQGLPLFQAAEGPPAGTYDPAKMLTTILKSGNKSTLIHETAHFFLHMVMDTASKESSSLEAKQDAQLLLDWFGVKDVAAWNAMTLDEQRQHHEAFALNWEIYVHEGKAPSVGLQKVFDAFSRYLKRVYVSIVTQLNEVHRKNFGVDLPSLTPEIKSVMDRMLATDAQISQREAIDNIKAQWETQEESGMNDGEWAALKEMEREAHDQAESDLNKASLKQVEWLTKANERLNTQAMMEFKRLRKTVSAEETAKMEKEPLRQAENFLKTGKMLDADGNEIEVAEGFKLDKSAVGAMYPISTTGLAPAVDLSKLRDMTMDGGLAPDLVAEMFGLSSGDELIRKLVDQKPFIDELQERTDARMEDEHGDLNTEEARQDAANQALHNELRARYIAVQNRFRNKIKTPIAQLMIAVKERAQEILAKMKLKDIRPTEFSSAEAREAKTQQDAHKAMQSPETASKTAYTRSYNEQIAAGVEESVAVATALEKGKAAAEKAQAKIDAHKEKYGDVMPEMVARKAGDLQELYNRLAKDAFDIKDSISRFVKYTKNVLSDDNRKRMGADASEQIEGILSRFGLVPPGKEPKMTLEQWVTQQTDKGLPPDIAPIVLLESFSIPFSEMTVEQFADLKDAVKYIEHVSKYENKAMKAARNKSFADFIPLVVKSVLEQNPRLIPFARRTARTGTEKANQAVAKFGLGQQRGGMMIRIIDGDKDGGIVSKFLLHTMDAQTGVESEFVTKTTEVLDGLLRPVLAEGKMGGSGELFLNLKSDAFPNGRSLNKEQRLAIALNSGNESNLQRLLGGERWTMDQIVPILRTLTDADWNFVEGVWDHFETYKPMVAELERKLNGKEPDWIEPKPFEIKTADGTTRTIKGGYYPVKFDPAAGPQAKIFEDVKDVKSASYAAHGAATTRRGYIKGRVEEVHDKPLLLNMNGMYSGFAEVIHDLAWREWLIDANRFMANKEIDKAIRDKYGAPFVDGIRDWIKRIAGGTNSDNVGGVFNFFRHKAVASTMAWKVATLWKHAFDISKTASILGADKGPIEGWKYVFNSAGHVFSNYNEAIKEAFANSPELRQRFNTRFRELNEIKNAVAGQSKYDKFMYTHGLILHHMLWKVTDVWTWHAAAKKYIANGFTNEEAYAMANRALIDSQGSGTVGNLSAVEGTRSPSMKLFTALSHYMINTSNILYVKTKTRTPGAAGTAKLVADYLQAVTVPVIYEELMRHAIMGLLPNKKKKKEEETAGSIMKEFAMAHADYLLGSVPIAREMSSGIKELFGIKTAGYQGPFGLKIIPDTILFARQAHQKEFDAEFRRAAIRLLGDGTGFPASQLNSTIDGVEALFKGETVNPLAPILGTRH